MILQKILHSVNNRKLEIINTFVIVKETLHNL